MIPVTVKGRPDLEVPKALRRNRTWRGGNFPSPILGIMQLCKFEGMQALLACNTRHYARSVRERPNTRVPRKTNSRPLLGKFWNDPTQREAPGRHQVAP